MTTDRVRRMTDLFNRGHLITLKDPVYDDDDKVIEDPILIWVQKLNSFERAEAQRDGQTVQSARLLVLTEESDWVRALRQEVARFPAEDVINAVVEKFESEALLLGRQDVHTMEEWRDKIVLIERWQMLDEDELSAEEREAAQKLNLKYLDAIQEAAKKRIDDKRDFYVGLPREHIDDEYIDEHRKQIGSEAFFEGFTVTEMYYAMRECNAVETTPHSREWDHTKCTHKKMLENRHQVRELSDGITMLVRAAIQQNNMSPDQAGNSVAPTTSSKS